MLMMLSGCTSDESEPALNLATEEGREEVAATLNVSQQGWNSNHQVLTRTGESVDYLRDNSFGIYCPAFVLQNGKISWNETDNTWKIGNYVWFLPRDFKVSVSFNGIERQSKTGYFSFTGSHEISEAYLGCTFDNIRFAQGLRMQDDTQIAFTNERLCTVTIVQSTATNGTLLFDGNELALESAAPITGARVYTLHGVAAGPHTIEQGTGGESGLFYVSANNTVFAYAPWMDSPNIAWSTPPAVDTDRLLPFTATNSNTTDLMWAHTTHEGYSIGLEFRHALAKVSFSSITNNLDEPLQLTKVTITDKPTGRLYQSGKLLLDNGTWQNLSAFSSEQKITIQDFDNATEGNQSLSVASGATESLELDELPPLLQIPGPKVTVTFTFTSASYGEETVSRDITLHQARNQIVSLTIGDNHQVVIVE